MYEIKCKLYYLYSLSCLDIIPPIGGCAGTRYGCCADQVTPALGPKLGCEKGK